MFGKAYTLGGIVAAIVIAILFFTFTREAPEPQTSSTNTDALCEVGVVNEYGQIVISENYPGVYEYTVLATSDGIKVMAPCTY